MMIKQVREIGAGVGAIALLGLVSCAGIGDDESPAELSGSSPVVVTPGQSGGQIQPQLHGADEVLVRFKSGVAAGHAAALHAQYAAQVVHEYRVPSNLQLVKVPPGKTVEEALDDYRRDPEVLYAEPNLIYDLDVTPNDPSFGSLWGMHNTGQTGGAANADINAPEAWNITKGSSAVVIGVLDSGVDYTHPDLAANIFTNPGEIAGNGIDDDGNGWIDDVHGINTITESGDPMDTNGHGTHVSGTIAARGDNGVGVAGVSWNATIVACRAFTSSATIADILQCMDYFLDLKTRPNNPVDIVATNNSWGGGGFSQALYDAIGAHKQAGMLFVAAAGNGYGSNNDQTPHYPSSYDHDNIIAVLATNHSDQRASFSNYGSQSVDVGAPGESILSTLPGNSYGMLSGTSMATPHVTGLVGLLEARDPSRTAAQIKNLILTGGTATPGTTGSCLSGRRIRANVSLTCMDQTLVNRFAPTASSLTVAVGTAIPLGILSITCDAPSSGVQVVTVVETGATIALADAGGTGEFKGTYTPASLGTSTLVFPNGDTVTVTAIANYDPAAVVTYELPAITGTALSFSCPYYYVCSTPVPSPFPLRFAGGAPGLTTLHVTNRGFVTFEPLSSYYGYDNERLPTSISKTVIAPFWDDLNLSYGGSVQYQVLGQEPGRQLVIEYRNVAISYGYGAVTFQVVFFENSPNIQFNYSDVDAGSSYYNNGASATVGVQVMTGLARQFSFNTPSLSNSMSLRWTIGAPIAAAGPDRVVLPHAEVELDGTGSLDFDGTIASYAWTQEAGTPVTLTGADTATPRFTAPAGSGTLTFQIKVTDDAGKIGTDTVAVTVNQAPVAVAGDDLTVPTDLPATLDGNGSYDPDGTLTGYRWTQIAGTPVQIQNAGAPVATFIAPPAAGTLVFQLTITDELGFERSDTVAADVFLNLKPVASAGQDRSVPPGASVTLDGTGSHDPDGSIASYAWTVDACHTIAGPCSLALAGAATATPHFDAPAWPGFALLSLTVTDNVGATRTDSVVISVTYQAPTAVIAAATSCVQGGSTVTLDGTGSQDADGTIASYAWTQLSGPPVSLSGAGGAVASFSAPAAGTLVFQLTVTDSDGLTDTAQVIIPIAPLPVADAAASHVVVKHGTLVTLDGSHSTGAVSYSWQQIDGVTATLSNASAVSPVFVAPKPGSSYDILEFKLAVTDTCGITSTDTIQVVVTRK